MKTRYVIKFWFENIVRHTETVSAEGYIEALAVALNRLGGWPTVEPFSITLDLAIK